MRGVELLGRRRAAAGPDRSAGISSWQDYVNAVFGYGGNQYAIGTGTLGSPGSSERIDGSWASVVSQGYKGSPLVFGLITIRALAFSEARFRWQDVVNGKPGRLWGDESLAVLERPWPGAITQDLLAWMEVDASLAGNSYTARVPGTNRLRRLRPDWVTIITGSESGDPDALDAEVVGYVYQPGGGRSAAEPVMLAPSDVAHYAPLKDPAAHWRGMSWVRAIIDDVDADRLATVHKRQFFRNGATPNAVITYDAGLAAERLAEFKERFDAQYAGAWNAYKTLHLGGGADYKVVGTNLRQMDFKATQGAGETRAAFAAGVPPVLAGLSEGLAGSSLNAGNYGMARRRFGDLTIRPLLRNAAGSLETIVPPPRRNSRLVADLSDAAFMREDAKDEAEIFGMRANAVRTLVDGGFDPASVAAAVDALDITQLQHTGLVSVQLLPPGEGGTGSADGTSSGRARVSRVRRDELGRVLEIVEGGADVAG